MIKLMKGNAQHLEETFTNWTWVNFTW